MGRARESDPLAGGARASGGGCREEEEEEKDGTVRDGLEAEGERRERDWRKTGSESGRSAMREGYGR